MARVRRNPLGSLQRDILDELSAGDILYGQLLSACSPRRAYRLATERAAARYRQKRAIQRLVESKYATLHGDRISITELGKQALGDAIAKTKQQLQNAPWDGRWRIVAFDIPEQHAGLRNKVRSILKQAGFQLLQQSVWVFPYECAELVHLIQTESAAARYVLYGVLEKIQGEERLKKMFKI